MGLPHLWQNAASSASRDPHARHFTLTVSLGGAAAAPMADIWAMLVFIMLLMACGSIPIAPGPPPLTKLETELRAMDRIVVIEQGRIVEDGSHDALVQSGGVYAGLWNSQVSGFIPD